MPHADFVHLRVHSGYSLSEGAITIAELVSLCRECDMPAMAVTDTGNLFGALEFSLAARAAGVQPVIGCQLAVEWARSATSSRGDGRPMSADPVVLLARDEDGYANLLKLVSRAYLGNEAGEPRVTLDDLAAHDAGLLLLSGGAAGPVGRLAVTDPEAAEALLVRLAAMFPDRLYMEIQRHGLEEEAASEPFFLDMAFAHDLPLVATNEVFFGSADMYEAHDALLCIAEGRYLSETDRRRLTPEHRFKSAAEMRALFADLPEAIDNTVVVARRCGFMPETRAPILPTFKTENGRTEPDELTHQAETGLTTRLNARTLEAGGEEDREDMAVPYRERLAFELDVITRMGFAGYFLIVADFIRWAKARGIPVGPGRGSGAGSVVAWSLGITELDPLRWGLLFERFLNPERVSMPDFDIDFCQERRDEVIRYVQEKYGRDRVAQIITFGTLQARAALRDVGRVLEMPYPQVDRICKLVPNNPANPVHLREAIEGETRLQEMRDSDPIVARLLDIALKLEGLYRHASTHAAGVVIGDRPLDELVPLYRDRHSDMPVTQFSMKFVERAGLVKFDFLGLKTLTVLARTLETLAQRGIEVDLAGLPLDDEKTYAMLGEGETVGVFQMESAGMRDALRRLKPDRFEELIAIVALYRPGPMDNIPRYINCKHGREEPDYLHPSLEGILKETFGVIIYQEQVMQVAQVLSGYDLGHADLLRRAMGKKIKAEMEAQRASFVDGAVARGVNKRTASRIFDQVDKFAGYGFNKSHAAAYALIAYQTAYLKATYPVAFLAASMNLDIGNTDKLNLFRQELGRLGVALLPPDINRSRPLFSVEPMPGTDGAEESLAIRYALAAVRNVGRGAMTALAAERDSGGPFADIFDFANRVDGHAVNKRQIENLACAGAFDELVPDRARMFAAAETVVRHAAAAANERESLQENLFGAGDGGEGEGAPRFTLPDVPEWSPMERLQREFEALGFYLSAHPLDAYGASLERIGVVTYTDLLERLAAAGSGGALSVKLAGTVLSKKERTSQRGNRYAFVTLSDATATYEITIFSEILAESRELLETGSALLITGEARLDGEQTRITGQRIAALDSAVAGAAAGELWIYTARIDALETVHSVMSNAGRGRGRVRLMLALEDREVAVVLDAGYAVSPAITQAIKAISGVSRVEEI